MRRLTFAVIAIMSLLGFCAFGVPATFAAHVLPELSVESSAKGSSGAMEIGLAGANFKCKKGGTSFTPTSKKLGLFTTSFSECSLGGKECHSLGDSGGVILLTGEWHWVLVEIPVHLWLPWYLWNQLHIECTFLSELMLLEGNVLGIVTPNGVETKNYEVKLSAKEGKQEATEFENDAGELVKASLEGSVNGGTKKAATVNSEANKLEFEKTTTLVN